MALIKVPTRGRVALADSDMPAGAVLQVVSTTNSRTQTGSYFLQTTADTWPSSTFALSITPTSTTSKIYVQITVGTYMSVGPAAVSIFRGSTNLGDTYNSRTKAFITLMEIAG